MRSVESCEDRSLPVRAGKAQMGEGRQLHERMGCCSEWPAPHMGSVPGASYLSFHVPLTVVLPLDSLTLPNLEAVAEAQGT